MYHHVNFYYLLVHLNEKLGSPVQPVFVLSSDFLCQYQIFCWRMSRYYALIAGCSLLIPQGAAGELGALTLSR